MRRTVVVLALLMLFSPNLLILPLCSATPKPYTPEFTATIFDSSYDTQPMTTVNPYTGETVTTNSSHVEMRTVQFRIKNEAFTPYLLPDDPNNWTVNYYFDIRWKGHYEREWNHMYLISDGYPRQDQESDYTVIDYACKYSSTTGLDFAAGSIRTTLPVGSQVDFQLKAMIGYVSRGNMGAYVFNGETSDWSSTQTLTIDKPMQTNTPGVSQSSASSSTNSQGSQVIRLDWVNVAVVGLLAVIAVLLVFVVFYLRRRSVGRRC
jgi:hypothetical protein